MTEYTCSVCNRKFDYEEEELTMDEYKCILHCDKNMIYTEKSVINKFDKVISSLLDNEKINKFVSIEFPKSDYTFLDSYENIIFENCTFYNSVKLNKQNYKILKFYKCKFPNGRLDIKNLTQKLDLIKIESCTFDRNFEILGCKNILNLKIVNSVFNKYFYIIQNNIKKLIIGGCEINDQGIISNNVITDNDIHGTIFKGITSFQYTEFNSNLDLNNIHFFSKVSFNNTTIVNNFNLRDAVFYDDVDFLDIASNNRKRDINDNYIGNAIEVNVENRETARKIKDSFEKQNNIIEANKYYAIEMIEREKELEITKNKNWFEWLVFKIHGISSNHSQDALLALFWIFVVGIFASLFDFYLKEYNNEFFEVLPFIGTIVLICSIIGSEYIFKDLEKLYYIPTCIGIYLIYVNTTDDKLLNCFSNVINPFSIMTNGDTLNLGMLIFKVIIAYLIYQFVVSVRQNTRRK